jgi:hypothetical protein
MNTRTPRKITLQVQEFCREVSEGSEPIYLAPIPSDQEIALDCFANVEKRVAEVGGSSQYDWRIWEWPNTMLEAEFHSVWLAPIGTPLDITPALGEENHNLFKA